MVITNQLQEYLDEGVIIRRELSKEIPAIISLGLELCKGFENNNKILLCGNGGSAADCQHIAAEYINKFTIKRTKSLAAIALTTDTSILTAVGNDYGYDEIFARQVEGLGRQGDVLIGISTSGNSKNVVKAVEKARDTGMHTIALTGEGGGKLAELCDITLAIPSKVTARIQEMHILVGHIICELLEEEY